MQRFLGDRLCVVLVRGPPARLVVGLAQLVNWLLCTAFEKVVPVGVLESPSQ